MTKSILLFTLWLIASDSLAQQVNTPDGPIKGIAETANSGKTYYAYYSIPYAKPPLGSLRLQPPEPVDPWTEVHDGSFENPNICFQVYADYPQENEDCLHLNVFTPQEPTNTESSLPVMLIIHGGGFNSGSGLVSSEAIGGMSPKYFMEEGIVFVSINYRLGPFGFLYTGDGVIPGNIGLRDQIMALKWVQRNIAAFGGDPEKIVISGTSAGAASVGYLILSPQAKGLFSAAIMESGAPLCPWAYQRNQTAVTFKMASFVDSQFDESTDSSKLLEVLQNADAKTIDKAGTDYLNWATSQPGAVGVLAMQQGFQYAPVIDSSDTEPVVPDYQYELAASSNVNQVPILIGTCSEEGLVNLDNYVDYYLQEYDNTPRYLVPQDLHISDEETWNEVGNLIKQEYSPLDTFANNKLGGIQYFTDQDFVKSTTKFADLQSSHSDVFYYQFSYSGALGWNTEHKLPGSGNVSHVEEWGYLYWGWPVDDLSSEDQLVHNRLVKLWSNFAKYHNPTPSAEELFEGIIWPKVVAGNFQYLNIGNFSEPNLTLNEGKPKAERMAFWKDIYDKYGNRPFDTY